MLRDLSLGGDGDEIEAIKAVEQEFGVILDKDDAPKWYTVGDVYSSLQCALSSSQRNDPHTWERFCVAISGETGVDAALVDRQTRLLGATLGEQIRAFFRR